MRVTLKLPRLSTNMQDATLADWYRKPGEAFAQGDLLYALETEKVTADVEAPCAGILLEVLLSQHDSAEVGDPVCVIDKTD